VARLALAEDLPPSARITAGHGRRCVLLRGWRLLRRWRWGRGSRRSLRSLTGSNGT